MVSDFCHSSRNLCSFCFFAKWKWASTWWVTPFLDETHTMVSDTSSLVQSHTYKKRDPVDVPYQTGQLHPAIRVADLLQHITQMKCAEGYGFKEEYEVSVRSKDLIIVSSASLVVSDAEFLQVCVLLVFYKRWCFFELHALSCQLCV